MFTNDDHLISFAHINRFNSFLLFAFCFMLYALCSMLYALNRYPPGTPAGESTTCHSWLFLARKEPAQDNR